jgi:glycosyltransferase involved in cell wall biosynthesis
LIALRVTTFVVPPALWKVGAFSDVDDNVTARPGPPHTRPLVPTWVGQLELAGTPRLNPILGSPEAHHRYARILARLHDIPLGFVNIPICDTEHLTKRAFDAACGEFASAIRLHLQIDGLVQGLNIKESLAREAVQCRSSSDLPDWPGISVVVCTRDRADHLEWCLPHLATLQYRGSFEIIVVDNASVDGTTRDRFLELVGADHRFRYVAEPSPGLSLARNRGLAEASHPIVAFTDDDALVDPGWLTELAVGFTRDPEAACVTGLVPAAELESPAQHYFDQRSGWSSTVAERVFDLGDHRDPSPVYPLAGVLGTGANFAVDRSFVTKLGGFDPVLGAGGPIGGGEDRDIFYRILFGGRSIVYEPSAIVWHIHRITNRELMSQLFTWGTGLAANLVKQMANGPRRREVYRRLPKGALHMIRLWRRDVPRNRKALPQRSAFVMAEALGLVVGPFAYWRARRQVNNSSTDSQQE